MPHFYTPTLTLGDKTMTKTVKITRYDSGFQNVAPRFVIGDYDDGASCLVNCAEYSLPDGYHVAESGGGLLEIYDDQDRHHEIIEHSSGNPQLIGLPRRMPVLRKAEADPEAR